MNKLNLTKIRKCDQIWEDMNPTERGRICDKCQSTIIDFRPLNDKEVAEIHMFSKGRVCGVYRKDQLELNTKERRKSKWKPGVLAMFGIFTSLNLASQNNSDSLRIEIHEPAYESSQQSKQEESRKQNRIKNDSLIVYGRIHNEKGEPLVGVTVLMQGTSHGTVTDFYGFYHLDIKKAVQDTSEIIFIYSYTGVTTKEIILDRNSLIDSSRLEVNPILEEDYSIDMSFGVVSKKDRFYHRAWRRTKGLFRRKN